MELAMLEIPDNLYQLSSSQCYHVTSSIELIRYTSNQALPKYEVKLNKSIFLFIISGKKKIRLYNQEIVLNEGWCAFIPKGAYIMAEILGQKTQSFSSIMILVEDNKLIDLWQNVLEPYPLDTQHRPRDQNYADWAVFRQSASIISSLETLELSIDSNKKIPKLLVEIKLQELLLYIASGTAGQNIAGLITGLNGQYKCRHLRSFMEKNYTQDWSVENYADNFGFSLSSFKRIFKENYDCSPKLWITNRRLEKVATELKSKDISLLEIALDAGFSGSSQLSKVFKRKYNRTPSKFRIESTS
jgi:AraC-like DNA-binding protein